MSLNTSIKKSFSKKHNVKTFFERKVSPGLGVKWNHDIELVFLVKIL